MRYLPNLLIALSMMAVVPAVAHNSWAADDGVPPAQTADPPGAAEDPDAPAGEEATARSQPEVAAPPIFGGPAQANHKYQTGLSIMPGAGYRLIVPYKEGQFCGDQSGIGDKRVCANYVPFFMDVRLSFGVASRADVFLDMRFGLQSDSAMPSAHQFALAPGIRFWLDQEVTLKFYTTLQFVFDYLDFRSTGPSNADVGMRNANGLMYDPIRNVGFFIQFAETVGMMRWFRIDLDIGIGGQIRFP